ncbi:SusD/RagB family nutrient-binding outer membrane lipoprotein [Mangrovivirga cuniculi]|uniref:SusD/RagB family nutrient-binding outer membrane lipoprotein n=1 Tax=Mangrovivirga cuniculi TaxID=2715131 RepID=A0A4D7JG90_9BACT|nr:SusD/RagB family nutrient-binding outer membrane lipoprotein [Mangrovivirga cuniculi]QCK14113.1 SusD/RagB family nutrient-binding outer membrane lipoprotein [Mangrovivirga cuniculi]
MKISFKILVALFVILGMTTACEDLSEINDNPNNPTRVDPASLFADAQLDLSTLYWGRALNFEFGMLMVQHFAQNEYAEDSRYNQNVSTFNGSWNGLYSRPMMDLMEAKKLVENQREQFGDAVTDNRLAALTIMEVFGMQAITDLWGDVPYSEAFQVNEFPNPSYDAQSTIYADLISKLNNAINSIDENASGFSAGDNLYGGDMAMWKKFGNSLKLRMGMRLADVESTTASTVVSEAIASGVFESNADAAYLVFGSDQRIANPFYIDETVNARDDFAISLTLTDYMEASNDPRLEYYAKPTPSGDIVGMPYGLTDGEAFELKGSTSRPADAIRQATAPAKLMTYSEVLFLQAEAVERGYVSGTAVDLFNDAILASMEDWGVDGADAATYAAARVAAYPSMDWEQAIGEEKWVALYTNGLEAFAEWRRLDYPQLTVPEAAVITEIPTRALYTSDELGNNANSVPEANSLTGSVYWDVN